MNIHLQESLNCCQLFQIKASAHAFGTHGITCVLFSTMGTEKFLARLRLNTIKLKACQSTELEEYKLYEIEIPKFQNTTNRKKNVSRGSQKIKFRINGSTIRHW